MIDILYKNLLLFPIEKICGHIFITKLHCILLLLLLLLGGCGTIATIDINQSDLMPTSIAMSIFEKHGFKQWTEKPFVSNIGSFCGTEKKFIEFNQIASAIYNPRFKYLTFISINKESRLCPRLEVNFPNLTESQALELTNAARALGATKIEKLYWGY